MTAGPIRQLIRYEDDNMTANPTMNVSIRSPFPSLERPLFQVAIINNSDQFFVAKDVLQFTQHASINLPDINVIVLNDIVAQGPISITCKSLTVIGGRLESQTGAVSWDVAGRVSLLGTTVISQGENTRRSGGDVVLGVANNQLSSDLKQRMSLAFENPNASEVAASLADLGGMLLGWEATASGDLRTLVDAMGNLSIHARLERAGVSSLNT